MSTQPTARERTLSNAFVALADSLVDDFDVIELLHRLTHESIALLPVDAAGLLLADQRGSLRVVTYSDQAAYRVEALQIESGQGPCVDCFHRSSRVAVADLREPNEWPEFSRTAVERGYLSVHALPMRLRAETIGTLNLFAHAAGGLSAEQLRVGQALADVATIGILQERAIRSRGVLAEQLQHALNSRVIIEQATGVLAERFGTSIDAGFEQLSEQARTSGRGLTELARAVVERDGSVPVSLR